MVTLPRVLFFALRIRHVSPQNRAAKPARNICQQDSSLLLAVWDLDGKVSSAYGIKVFSIWGHVLRHAAVIELDGGTLGVGLVSYECSTVECWCSESFFDFDASVFDPLAFDLSSSFDFDFFPHSLYPFSALPTLPPPSSQQSSFLWPFQPQLLQL
ncbi:hypothetical protein C8R48DRAFT_770642 [Suillus tomentosus]|nr:hypothetical protein C8R48DRAFT_770642 [Suillus tomentosus]